MVSIVEVHEGGHAHMQNARAALRMIRETIETLGPPGALPSEEAVLKLYGLEPVHEAEALVTALRKLLGNHHG